jgi:hypothetical protein
MAQLLGLKLPLGNNDIESLGAIYESNKVRLHIYILDVLNKFIKG